MNGREASSRASKFLRFLSIKNSKDSFFDGHPWFEVY